MVAWHSCMTGWWETNLGIFQFYISVPAWQIVAHPKFYFISTWVYKNLSLQQAMEAHRVVTHWGSWLYHSNYNRQKVQVMKLLIMQFLLTSCHFIFLQPKYSQTLMTDSLSLCSSLNVSEKVSYPYKTTGKTLFLWLQFLHFRQQMGRQKVLDWMAAKRESVYIHIYVYIN
jgi:hypothetical protein